VSGEATLGLLKVHHLVTGESIWKIFVATRERHIRRNSLYLIARLSKWESAVYLVEALVSGDQDVEGLVRDYIRRWHARFNRTFLASSQYQVDRLKAALARSSSDKRMIEQIVQLAIRGQ
jgi:hypothetical protein